MAIFSSHLDGPGGRLFADPKPTPDETSFQVDNTSEQYYDSPYYTQHQNDLQPFPAPRSSPSRIDLADVLPGSVLDPISSGQRITFHAVGDTGAAKNTDPASLALADEAGVADAMSADVNATGGDAGDVPAFFFHLGDVVYEFGEDRYYYDQFYEPFREYDRPIFAIPGNHDGVVYGESATKPAIPTLTAFLRNFCASTPAAAADAGALVRSTMDQPGVYFTLDAPHVSIIGLYSNVLEGPGVISTESGHYPTLNDDQLAFLTSELERLGPESEAGTRAVLLAVHHPPASSDTLHGGSLGLSNDIDACAQKAGHWPDAVLSGHAHLYQRFTRVTPDKSRQIPYIISGAGGYAATKPSGSVKVGDSDNGFTLAAEPIVAFGYLTIAVDVGAHTLTSTYHRSDGKPGDTVTVNLADHTIAAAKRAKPPKTTKSKKAKKP